MERQSGRSTRLLQPQNNELIRQSQLNRDDTYENIAFGHIRAGTGNQAPDIPVSDFLQSGSYNFGPEMPLERLEVLTIEGFKYETWKQTSDINMFLRDILLSNIDLTQNCVNLIRLIDTYFANDGYVRNGVFYYEQNTREAHSVDEEIVFKILLRLSKIIVHNLAKESDIRNAMLHLIKYNFNRSYRTVRMTWNNRSQLSVFRNYDTSEDLLNEYVLMKLSIWDMLLNPSCVFGGNYNLVYSILFNTLMISCGSEIHTYDKFNKNIRIYEIPNVNPQHCREILNRKPSLSTMYVRSVLVTILIRGYSMNQNPYPYLTDLRNENPYLNSGRVIDGGIRSEEIVKINGTDNGVEPSVSTAS